MRLSSLKVELTCFGVFFSPASSRVFSLELMVATEMWQSESF